MATFQHGSKAALWLNDGSSLVDISAAVTSANLDRARDTAETSAFGSTAKSYIGGLRDATLSFDGNWDQTLIDNILDAYDQDAAVAFEFYPVGQAGSGLPKESGNVIVTSVSQASSVDDKVTFSCELQVTGAVTRGTDS